MLRQAQPRPAPNVIQRIGDEQLREKIDDGNFMLNLSQARLDEVFTHTKKLLELNPSLEVQILYNLDKVMYRVAKDQPLTIADLKSHFVSVFPAFQNLVLPSGVQENVIIVVDKTMPPEQVEQFQIALDNVRMQEGQQDINERLADVAEVMPRLFPNVRWTVSGGDETDNFQIKVTQKKNLGMGQSETTHNDFGLWIRKLAAGAPDADEYEPQPDQVKYMNCWEGVMFTAYQAGLVTKDWLASIHKEAAQAGVIAEAETDDPNKGKSAYTDFLMKMLGYENAIPMDEQAGLMPQRGDILFFNQSEHVGLALGAGQMMQLWSDPTTTMGQDVKRNFNITDIGTIAGGDEHKRYKVEFAPPPFR